MTMELSALPELVMDRNLWTLTADEMTELRRAHVEGKRVHVVVESFGQFGSYISRIKKED